MANSYTTHKIHLHSADFKVLVMEFPDSDEVNDRLALLAPEKGLIYRRVYEDFVISGCLANSGPFFYHIKRRKELLPKYAEIRDEVLSVIFEKNPGFLPDNIVINDNNLCKTQDSVPAGEETRPLVDNDLWDQDPPLSNFGPSTLGSAPKRSDGQPVNLDKGLDADEEPSEPPADNPFADAFDGSEEVPYELIGHKWDTPGVHLNIRQYEDSEEARVLLLGGAPFESKRGFHLLLVQLCIEDFADVLHLLDKTGVSKLHNPNTLMAELYEIAVLYNPNLKLENLDLKALRQRFKELNKTRNRRVAAEAGAEPRRTKRRGIKFTDVPQDKILNLGALLRKRIQGQDEALELVSDAVARATVGLKRQHEPLGVFMFTGNTGVGKTETAKALADALGAHLVRIDCQEYQHQHEVAKLTGSPPGYIGYDDGGHLTKEVTKYPFSVVLFDEIEKAHSNFHERVLQIVDDGVLTESKGGTKVSFDETIIIMTSNIGVKEIDALSNKVGIGAVSAVSNKDAAKARAVALKHKFKPEFLNRIDEVVHFRLLDSDNYLQILELLLDEVQDQLSGSRNIALNFNVGAKNFLIDHGVDAKFGARPLRRSIKKHLNTPLSKAILKGEVAPNTKVTVSLKPSKDGLAFRTTGKKKVVSEE